MKRLLIIALLLATSLSLRAQSTVGVSYGIGSGSVRAYPSIESKSIYGLSSFSLSWRNYTDALFLGCVGVDLEYMERGFAYAPYTSSNNTDGDNSAKDLLYYYRYVNSVMVPIVWQPYVYMFDNHARVFAEAAVTFSYNLSSTYKNELEHSYGTEIWEGEYELRDERDNRWGYGLAFGGGIAYLVGRFELQASARYYFSYSDLMKNRTLYYSNTSDNSAENPFSITLMRSPIDNLNIKVGVSYRLTRDDYAAWYTKRIKSSGLRDGFGYDDQKNQSNAKNSKANSSSSSSKRPTR